MQSSSWHPPSLPVALIPVRPQCVARSSCRATSCEEPGWCRTYTVEGGFYAIRGDDDVTYDPTNLSSEFKQDLLRVRFEGRLLRDRVNFHMAGPIIELTSIIRE